MLDALFLCQLFDKKVDDYRPDIAKARTNSLLMGSPELSVIIKGRFFYLYRSVNRSPPHIFADCCIQEWDIS